MSPVNRINRDRYESITKRDFKTALVRLLEGEYKILGSRRVLLMLADDLEQLHQEFFPQLNRLQSGDIVWQTTKDDGQHPSYGKRTEDYAVQTVILPLVRTEDIERRIFIKQGNRSANFEQSEERDLKTLIRLVKSAKSQGGLLSGAEVSVLINRSLTSVGHYLKRHFMTTGEVLPMKGYVLDQGSNPSHKAGILALYEQGISPADIVLRTGHTQSAVDNYIKTYDQVLALVRKKHDAISISQITGRSLNTVRQYLRVVKDIYPQLKVVLPDRQPGKPRRSTASKHKKK